MSDAVLKALLSDGIRFAPNYKPVSNSDHLPMTLAAMHGLGATDAALIRFRDEYAERLHTWEAGDPVDDWQNCLGQREKYPALLLYFQSRLQVADAQDLLEEVLPGVLMGVALDAFHPLIRLGYGVAFNTMDEIAAGLAYMVSVHEEMPLGFSSLDLQEAIVQQAEQGAVEFRSNRFSESLKELVDQGRYPVGSVANLQELAKASLDIYLATRNFFALHLVTSTQALRMVTTPATEQTAMAAMSGAVLASHVVLQSPAIGESMVVPEKLDPEHAIKYVYSCLVEYREYGDGRYVDEIRSFRDSGLVPAWVASDLLDQTD